ncbi:MAG: ATP-binding protein [Bacteroidales bacterium]
MRHPIPYLGENGEISLKALRVGLFAGVIIYSLFGIIDPFMAPDHYRQLWFIRFVLVAPGIVFSLLLTYQKHFHLYARPLMIVLLFLAELGILGMIYIAEQNEPAYLGYYAGLVLIILWAGFIFRFGMLSSTFFFLSSIILYNAIAIFAHELNLSNTDSDEFAFWLGNNFFLGATGILALVGINSQRQNTALIRAKNKKLRQEQEELTKSKIKAEESDMLKTAFLSNLSHEIRTPMNGIIGFTEMMLQEKTSKQEKAEYADIVIQSTRQLLTIINNVLDVSKIQTGQIELAPVTTGVNDSLRNVEARFKPRAEANKLDLRLHVATDKDPVIKTDHFRMRQIIALLLDNAIKYTKEGRIDFGYEICDDKLVFFVKDTGIGIEDKYHNLVFDAFRQVEYTHTRSFGGAGIGLSIAKNLVSLLGGTIWIENNSPQGSIFKFSLPRKQDEQQNNHKPTEKGKPFFKAPACILLAEDDANNLAYFTSMLKTENLEILIAGNENELKDKLHIHAKNTDLIFLSISDKNEDKVSALQAIREMDQQFVVIAHAAFNTADDKISLLEKGFDDFLTKPLSSKELYKIIRKHLSHKIKD